MVELRHGHRDGGRDDRRQRRKTATITNEANAIFNIKANVGIKAVAGGGGTFTNAGLLEKTAGKGVGTIGLAIANKKTITVASGTLDLKGAVTGKGTMGITGGATLKLDGTVAATQTVAFGAGKDHLVLADRAGFKASLSGFGSGDTIDLADSGRRRNRNSSRTRARPAVF